MRAYATLAGSKGSSTASMFARKAADYSPEVAYYAEAALLSDLVDEYTINTLHRKGRSPDDRVL